MNMIERCVEKVIAGGYNPATAEAIVRITIAAMREPTAARPKAGANARERASTIWDKARAYDWKGFTGHYHVCLEGVVASEIQAYGDERAREARDALDVKAFAAAEREIARLAHVEVHLRAELVHFSETHVTEGSGNVFADVNVPVPIDLDGDNLHPDYDVTRLRRAVRERDAEIARLSAPPGADVMAIAEAIARPWLHGSDEHRKWLREIAEPDIARALQQYGDERAAAAVALAELGADVMQIAKQAYELRAPPGADVMERVRTLNLVQLDVESDEDHLTRCARALQQYGDERVAAAKAEIAPLGDGHAWGSLPQERIVNDIGRDGSFSIGANLSRAAAIILRYGDERAAAATERTMKESADAIRALQDDVREARAAAIEEAAHVADGAAALVEASPHIQFVTAEKFGADLAKDIADGIRALTPKPGSET